MLSVIPAASYPYSLVAAASPLCLRAFVVNVVVASSFSSPAALVFQDSAGSSANRPSRLRNADWAGNDVTFWRSKGKKRVEN